MVSIVNLCHVEPIDSDHFVKILCVKIERKESISKLLWMKKMHTELNTKLAF
jgi:hypothetical protein